MSDVSLEELLTQNIKELLDEYGMIEKKVFNPHDPNKGKQFMLKKIKHQ